MVSNCRVKVNDKQVRRSSFALSIHQQTKNYKNGKANITGSN